MDSATTSTMGRPAMPKNAGTWLLALLAPLLVIAILAGLHSVPIVFATYHVGLCLMLPAVLAKRAGLGWRDHARQLGLVRRGVGAGILLGMLMAAAPVVAFALRPDLFPDATLLRRVLSGWGVDPAAPGALFVFMGLVNGPAEELYWRGWLQHRLLRGPRSGAVLVLLFASYHVFTVGALAPGMGGMALMLVGVVGAGAFWTWSRAHWGSVWPAALSHAGGTLGYLIVCWRGLI